MKREVCSRCQDSSMWACGTCMFAEFFGILTHRWGTLVEFIRGPSVTTIYDGRSKSAVEQLRPTHDSGNVDLLLEAREIIFVTHYRRRWIPDVKRAVYEVHGSVNVDYRHLFDERLFDSVTYPMLCHPFLRGTRYPHLYAMLAHLGRCYPHGHPFRDRRRKSRIYEQMM